MKVRGTDSSGNIEVAKIRNQNINMFWLLGFNQLPETRKY